MNSSEVAQNDPTVIFLSLLAVIPAHLLTLAASWAVVTKFNKFSFKETLGWEWGSFRWWYFPLIIAAFFVLVVIVTTFLPEQENEMTKMLKSSRSAVFVTAILATFTAPIVEEVIYRGILYSAFQRAIGVVWAVILVTTLFAAVHFLQYWGSPGTILLICVLSLVLTLIRVKTKNLLPCIILHFIFNGIQSVFLILQPYLPDNPAELENKASAALHLFK
jgi:membrane protease YdiL (CAAX protease family)